LTTITNENTFKASDTVTFTGARIVLSIRQVTRHDEVGLILSVNLWAISVGSSTRFRYKF